MRISDERIQQIRTACEDAVPRDYATLYNLAVDLASDLKDTRAELQAAMTLLAPICAQETLEGAIRNLQQAHISESGNSDELKIQLQAAQKRIEELTEGGLIIEYMGTTCGECSFQYREYQGHIIPCPRCELNSLRERAERAEGALRQILIGKITQDNKHPQGEGWAMAYRFINIARAALAGGEGKEAG